MSYRSQPRSSEREQIRALTHTLWSCGRMAFKRRPCVCGESGFASKAALGRGSSLLPSTVFGFPPVPPSLGTLRQCWVLSAIAQSKPQPLLV